MKVLGIIKLTMVVIGLILTVAGKLGEAQESAASVANDTPKRVIVISLADRKLALIEDGEIKKVYAVAIGKPSTPSPVGTFTIENRVTNPSYSHEGRIVPPGPQNPVGSRWMGLSLRGYGIHGTNVPGSIGKAASHGCIRMGKADVEELFSQVRVGDTVEFIGQRNEETAKLFGISSAAPQTPPTIMASVSSATPVAGSM
jgi:lipoprotein-anchoring transpeptidase ErfK/SrfK